MISLLEHLNYTPPTLNTDNFGPLEIKEIEPGYYYLYINGDQWMAYNTKTHLEAYQLYSHYILAEGHVIVTGMGFGVRENWILSKPSVTKLTIIEINKNLIDYHKQLGSSFIKDPRVEIINCDASEYKGSCDVLLLDHFEKPDNEMVLTNVKLIQDNIDCKKMWFWPLEKIIMHSRKWHTFNDEARNLITKYDAYKLLKNNWKLDKLYDFSEDEINLMCMMFNSNIFSQSEGLLTNRFSDRETYQELYGYI